MDRLADAVVCSGSDSMAVSASGWTSSSVELGVAVSGCAPASAAIARWTPWRKAIFANQSHYQVQNEGDVNAP
jgi:hypothetical protein